MEKFQLPPEYDSEELRKLVELFPQFWKENYFDFDEMKSYVSGIVPDDLQEKYSFTWHGKTESYRLLKKNSNGTLRPCIEESLHWDATQNLYIEGDNLEVLKLIKHTYAGENGVKMIYIDPPYNSNEDFIYDDTFIDGLDKYLEYTNQKGRSMPEVSGRYHTRWLNMMYPRLWLANYLLKDDGVIFISIDDREAANLRKLCDEIFGEENFLCQAVWDLGTGTTAGHFTRSHEYVIGYAKNKADLPNFKAIEDSNIIHGALKKISKANPATEITFPIGFPFEGTDAVFTGVLGGSEQEFILSEKMEFKDGKLVQPTTIKAGWGMANQIRDWIEGKETYDSKGQKVVRFYFNKSGILFYEKERGTFNPKTVISDVGSTRNGSLEIESLFHDKIFDFPKPVDLIKYLALMITHNSDTVMDFFSGSATTAHAIMQLNAEDCGNRRFIMVQLPEEIDPKKNRASFDFLKNAGKPTNICEIGKERIRRAGAKIAEQNPNVDIGFRVFKLDKSNFRTWDNTPIERNEADKLIQQMELYANSPFVEGRSHEDIVYEVIRMNNYPLTTPILPIDINTGSPGGKKIVYGIGENCDFIICLDVLIGETEAGELCKYQPGRILFTDSCFENTEMRVNVEHIIKNINAKIKLRIV